MEIIRSTALRWGFVQRGSELPLCVERCYGWADRTPLSRHSLIFAIASTRTKLPNSGRLRGRRHKTCSNRLERSLYKFGRLVIAKNRFTYSMYFGWVSFDIILYFFLESCR